MQTCGHTPKWRGPTVERVLSNGKRFYFTAFKTWLVEQARQPGASVSGLATRHGINTNLLRHWMQLQHWQAAPTTAVSPCLLPIEVSLPAPPARSAADALPHDTVPIELQIGDAVLRLRAPIDAQALRQVLQCLRGTPAAS
jgi:transposase